MEKLSELKKMLSDEKKKPINGRNKALIKDLHGQISDQKKILRREFIKRKKDKIKAEVGLRLSLWEKKTKRYAKIRVANKKERIEQERQITQKLQQRKK